MPLVCRPFAVALFGDFRGYFPMQVFSEYLRYIQKTDSGKKYDGIIYKSSLTTKKNIVLFYDNKTSEDVLILNNIEIVKCHIE